MNSDESEFFDSLLLSGAIEVVAINPDNGEFMYNITSKMKDVFPELYNEHLNKIDADLKALWEKGFLEINIFEANPTVFLSTKAFSDEEIDGLPSDLAETLAEIKRVFGQNI